MLYGQSLAFSEGFNSESSPDYSDLKVSYSGPWLAVSEWENLAYLGAMHKPVDQCTLDKLCAEYLNQQPSEHSHRVFRKAGKLFDAIRSVDSYGEKPAKLKFRNEEERRQALELAHASLPYHSVLESVLDEVRFYRYFPKLQKSSGIVMVMLYDFIKRQFQPLGQRPGQLTLDSVRHIEEALLSRKTAINAGVARQRIQQNVLTVEELLPQNLKELLDALPCLPQYAWINYFKASLRTVVQQLCDEGFTEVASKDDLKNMTFCRDLDCSDLLIFHASNRLKLASLSVVESFHLVIQRKSSCLGPYTIANIMLKNITSAIQEDPLTHVVPYIMLTHINQGWSVAHLASLVGNACLVVACAGELDDKDFVQVQQRLLHIGAYNVKILRENFLSVTSEHQMFSQVTAILASPESSNSGVCDPVDFILRENGDVTLLREKVSFSAAVSSEQLQTFHDQQLDVLRHGLRFTSLECLIYCTHSVHNAENYEVVKAALEEVNEEFRKDTQQKCQQTKPKKFIQLEHPPEMKYKVEASGICGGLPVDPVTGCLQTKPSVWLEGYFIAVIKKQSELKVTAKDILTQAKAKGLLHPSRTVPSSKSITRSKTSTLSKWSSGGDICCCSSPHKGRCLEEGTTVCARCRKKGVYNMSPPSLNRFLIGSSSPLNLSSNPSSDIRDRSSSGSGVHSPGSWIQPPHRLPPFPVLRSRPHPKRILYPMALKTLRLAGIGPPSYPPQYTITSLFE